MDRQHTAGRPGDAQRTAERPVDAQRTAGRTADDQPPPAWLGLAPGASGAQAAGAAPAAPKADSHITEQRNAGIRPATPQPGDRAGAARSATGFGSLGSTMDKAQPAQRQGAAPTNPATEKAAKVEPDAPKAATAEADAPAPKTQPAAKVDDGKADTEKAGKRKSEGSLSRLAGYKAEVAHLLGGDSAARRRRKNTTASGLPAPDPATQEPPIKLTRPPRKGTGRSEPTED